MLKAIVQNQHVRAEALLEEATGLEAVGADAHGCDSGAQENLRLIARLSDLYARAGLKDEMPVERVTAVAAGENAGLVAGAPHLFGKVEDQGRLAGAAHTEVADANDGGAEAAPATVIPAALPDSHPAPHERNRTQKD